MNNPATNPKNDRLKRDYLIWLGQAKQRSPATVEQARHAIDRWEAYTQFRDFGTFNREKAIGFKQKLATMHSERSGKPMSLATVHHTLQAIKDFLGWLQAQPGFRRKILSTDLAYLSLTKGEERQLRASPPKTFATVDEYRRALAAMPVDSQIGRRDRAVMALLLMTGMRDRALIGLKIRDVNLDRKYLFQDPRHISTKFRKQIDTFFLPVGEDVLAIFREWLSFLREMGFAQDDPVFPKTVTVAGGGFAVQELGRQHWANAGPVRKCFREAFARIGVPVTRPHSIRDTLTQFAYSRRFSPEQMKAFSQNLGHDSLATTYANYGQLSRERQGEVILALDQRAAEGSVNEISTSDLANILANRLRA